MAEHHTKETSITTETTVPGFLDLDSGMWSIEVRDREHRVLVALTVPQLEQPESCAEMWKRCPEIAAAYATAVEHPHGAGPLYLARFAQRLVKGASGND